MATTSPGASLRRDGIGDGVRVVEKTGGSARGVERADNIVGMQALSLRYALLLIDRGENGAIGEAKTLHEIVRQNLAAERVGTRLENGPEPRARINRAQRPKSFADGSGVVREVFDKGDAVDFGTHFEASLDALETGEGLGDGVGRDTLPSGKGRGGGGVEGVVFAREVHFEFGPCGAGAKDLPVHPAVLIAKIADAPLGGLAEAVALDAAESAADAIGYVFAPVVRDNKAAARDEVDESFEGGLDLIQIAINVGVVELDVRKDERVRKVVEKLGTLVEESGVVFVALEDEGACRAQLKTGAKVLRDAADEERRLTRGIASRGYLVNPRENAGGGCLAVGSGDNQRLAAFEKFLTQQCGHRGERNALVEDALNFRIAA